MTSKDYANIDARLTQIRAPPIWSGDPELWFIGLETQFEADGTTNDNVKYKVVCQNMDRSHMSLVREILAKPPASGRYDLLKNALIQRIGDSAKKRAREFLWHEQMGDRTPSQFYRDLRSLATPETADEYVRAIWESRLPLHIQNILASSEDPDIERLTRIADRIHENQPEPEHVAAISAYRSMAASNPPAIGAGPRDPFAITIKELRDDMKSIRAEINALRIRDRRRPRSRSLSRTRYRRRSSSRDTPRQDGLCYYHATYRERARNCRTPCRWKTGNAVSRP